MKAKPFLKALSVVTLFWWIVLMGFGIRNLSQESLASPSDYPWLSSSWMHTLAIMALDVCMGIGGIAFALRGMIKKRNAQMLTLRDHHWFGLHSSLGSIQAAILSPRAQSLPTKSEEDRLIRSLSLEFSPMILKFMDQTQLSNPVIASAMRTCLAILCLEPEFPASSHHKSNSDLSPEAEAGAVRLLDNHHGQCTLLEHSLRVAAFVILERERFSYQGLQTDLRTLIAPTSSFQLDCQDPFPVLLGLVHDIGKLQTFHVNESNEVTQVKGHHGPLGAMFLSQLACIKALSAAQQHALYKALYHYHNPYHFTVKDLNQLEGDYVVANMMLLIKADKKASLAERLGHLSKGDAAFFEYFITQ